MRNSVIVDAAKFRAALELAVVERKTTIPVLSNIMVRPVENGLQLVSTDLDLSVITDLDGLTENETPFLLPYHKVRDLLKGETGTVTLTWKPIIEKVKVAPEPGQTLEQAAPVEDADTETPTIEVERESRTGWTALEVGGCVYELACMAMTNFPEVPEPEPPAFYIPGEPFKAALGRVTIAISKEESRYTLNGALLRTVGSTLTMVGTDGHRLAVQTIELESRADSETIVSSDALAWLQKRVGKRDIGVYVGENTNTFYVNELNTRFTSRKKTGEFPNYYAVMPARNKVFFTAVIDAADQCAKLLTKVAQMADERSGAVRFALNGELVLSASSSDMGTSRAKVPARVTHPEEISEMNIGFNSSFVLDFLKQAGKHPVTLNLIDGQSAGFLECEEIPGYTYVLMPMRM